MALWRYTAKGGNHTVDEADLKARIRAGKIPGVTRVQCLDDDQWRRVDVDIVRELNIAEYDAGIQDFAEVRAQRISMPRHRRKILPPPMIAVLYAG